MNAETGARLKRFAAKKAGQPVETHDLKFSPDGSRLISPGTQERIRLWKAAPIEK